MSRSRSRHPACPSRHCVQCRDHPADHRRQRREGRDALRRLAEATEDADGYDAEARDPCGPCDGVWRGEAGCGCAEPCSAPGRGNSRLSPESARALAQGLADSAAGRTRVPEPGEWGRE